jgi:pSer/pThr/pTyr-binding forkhead associated (FHA) protein
MNFQLTIAEGKEAGREFVFDRDTVSIGRSSECDVVLYDPGVSRRHARLTIEGEAVYVEDSGSANGTKVNGELIPREERRQLEDGDRIILGPVVFGFTTQVQPEEPAALAVVDQSTRIVDVGQVKRQKNRGVGLVPAGVEHEELSQLARKHTAAIPAVTARKLSRPDNRAALAPVPDQALEVARPPVRERRQTPARPQLSAVERSRLKREAREGIGGMIKLWWAESSAVGRALVYLGGVATVAGALALVWWAVLRDGQSGPGLAEPTELSSNPVEYSFGLGAGVDFERSDQKAFGFTYVAATRAVVILHFQSSDISAGEVLVSVNGEEVGQLPPDPINPTEVTHELILPPERLKKAEFNQVVFDNLKNPPGNEPWRVWNVWMEIAPLPEQPPAELLRDARADYDRGLKDLERKNIGARNRYDAWRNFRSAWLRLEAHPLPKPELYEISRIKVREAQQELDAICAKLLLEVERAYNQKDFAAAMGTLEHVREYFPNNDQSCPSRANKKRLALEL